MDKLDEALDLLQVDINIDEKTLKQKRNALLKKYHPDRAMENNDSFGNSMAKINSAYDEILQFLRYKNLQKIETECANVQQPEITPEQDDNLIVEQNNDSVLEQKFSDTKEENTYNVNSVNNYAKNKEKIKFQIFIGIISTLILFFIFLLIF